ncbi:hypothetical protein PIB30_080035 [Stylosanthes scabra]|uniref:Uncharacterized protein n=1 Tax=Stylosanthes scabra TaxID=79078 RepID=A0ABU6VQY1_9FABA|nr:hypothetical protein [Stylosanthes scabra]
MEEPPPEFLLTSPPSVVHHCGLHRCHRKQLLPLLSGFWPLSPLHVAAGVAAA